MIKHTTMLHCLRLTAKDPQITIAYDFYDWVSKNIQGVTAKWVPKEEVIENEKALLVRFETAFDIDGIKSHHALIPRVPQGPSNETPPAVPHPAASLPSAPSQGPSEQQEEQEEEQEVILQTKIGSGMPPHRFQTQLAGRVGDHCRFRHLWSNVTYH
ncbi:uncharacterized protein LOC117647879 [Thrips palmi]|uniref:Uncharacterized protein LOC117647879 n=1 Tax=Thrips palmi TaxID=161013 RepID=A0A6P8ZBZ6_THRPL|nr:uncharacterized protein LOC117647879 [Thrips palmi]